MALLQSGLWGLGKQHETAWILQSSLIYSICCRSSFLLHPSLSRQLQMEKHRERGNRRQREKSETIVWFLPGLNTVCFGFQTWQLSNRKCQLIRAMAWHGTVIAAAPLAGLQPSPPQGNGSVWWEGLHPALEAGQFSGLLDLAGC